MTNKEILEKAIQKAIDGKYELPLNARLFATENDTIQFFEYNGAYLGTTHAYAVIFNHEFAKALWGNRTINALTGEKFVAKKLPEGVIETVYVDTAWEYHLKQMVIAEDPIKYLGDHLNA